MTATSLDGISQSTEMQKFDFFKNEDFTFCYSILDSRILIHCYVDRWSVSVAKIAYRVFNTFVKALQDEGVSCFYSITPNPKFAKLFNGECIKMIEYDGNKYEVIKWEC